MVALTITPLVESGVELLPPDIDLFDGRYGDFAISTDLADGPLGGLKGRHPIATAVCLCLLTDARCTARELRFEMGGDRRGWPGDGISLFPGDTGFGSTIWLYRRSELTDETGREIEAKARRALQSLLDEKLAASVTVAAEVQKATGRIDLAVAVYGRDGRQVYADRFDALWRTTTPF